MDYIIDLSSLSSKSSDLNSSKSNIDTINDMTIYGDSDIDPYLEKINETIKRIKNGYNNASTWMTGYIDDMNTLESNLASLNSANLITPTEFNKEFEDIFSKVTMPAIKTGGDTVINKNLGTLGEDVAFTVDVPDDLVQSAYTVTCYEADGWHLGGSSKGTAIASGTNQKAVHEAWVADGARYKNGIAVINVNGEDHYLVATSQAFGKVGDSVTMKLKNGDTVPCVIADAKSTHDSNYTKYGHSRSNGSVNVLEFEVDTATYKAKGNPTTESYGLEWDSSSGVASADNHGSII